MSLKFFDRLEIRYLVGGSLASSVHGIGRATMDADIVAEIRRDQVDEFTSELEGQFYVDADMIRSALDRGRSFNLIHYSTSFKIDIFPLLPDDYSQAAFARRVFLHIKSLDDVPIECTVATAEDTILSKLRLYRSGGETSEQQWKDLRGIRDVQAGRLDLSYLHHWALRLGIADLLERLLSESS